MLDTELKIDATVSTESEPYPGSLRNESFDEKDLRQSSTTCCKINVQLKSYTNLQDVQIFLTAMKPVIILNDYVNVANLSNIFFLYIFFF